MKLPPSDFADTFRAVAVPRLRPSIDNRGRALALDLETFSDARGKVMAEAMRLGAGYLPTEHLTAFIDWVDSAILAAMDEAEARSERVWRDVLKTETAIRAHFAVADG